MSSIDDNLSKLHRITTELRRSNQEINHGLDNAKVVDVATRHLELHQQMETVVAQLKSEEFEIPRSAVVELNKSKNNIKILAKKVATTELAQKMTDPQETYIDPSNLLTTATPKPRPSLPNIREWELNCGLLYSIYQRTDDENVRSTLRFLMFNYLAKAAHLNADPGFALSSKEFQVCYEHMLQLGALTSEGMYHRSLDQKTPFFNYLQMNQDIGSTSIHSLVPLETTNVTDLYCTRFVPILDLSKREEAAEILAKQYEENIDLPLEELPEFPVLIDITDQIGQDLITYNNPERIKLYEQKAALAKQNVNEIFELAKEKIKQKHPDQSEDRIMDYMRINTAVVSRARISDSLAVLQVYTRFYSDEDMANPDIGPRSDDPSSSLKKWAERSGLNPGAVQFRMLMAKRFKNLENPEEYTHIYPKVPEYAVPGKTDTAMYSTPQTLLQTNSFKLLKEIGEGKHPQAGQAQQLMAKATAQMIETLFQGIEDRMMDHLPDDPAAQKAMEERLALLSHPSIQELIQTTVFRISQHMATATHNTDDFRLFIQGIDLIHTELTTLLLLFKPFDVETYNSLATSYLSEVVPDSRLLTSIGITRSAMSAFTAVNAAILNDNPNPVRICGEHSYYEEVEFVGGNLTLTSALSDPNIKKVDLYVAEFNHNIDIDPNHTVYEKGDVIQDIKKIFEKKPDTDALTVVIDATIDFTNSEDLKKLIATFRDEIDSGRLNIVVIRSGQKFDMLGLDNYFGAPFYIINNGDEKWNKFKKIKTGEAFQTDPLSLQFFTWMATTGLNLPDEYKGLIFQNTRAILDEVPEGLRPNDEKRACVCTAHEDVKSPFIDIKIDRLDDSSDQVYDQEDLRNWVQARFTELFIENKKLAYMRGSFGFPNPNITWIEPKMRINPGIDPSDIPVFAQFFKELDAKIKEMGMDKKSSTRQNNNYLEN